MFDMRTILLMLIVFTCFSCKKLEDIKTPDFNVNADKEIYHVGDSVIFNFSGEADVISVYTGELGSDYDYREGRVMESEFKMSFETQVQNGTQQNQLYILLSKDFTEDYSLAGVAQANWTDLTNRFTFPANPSSVFLHSGLGDISDLFEGETDSVKIYLAVKHVVRDQSIYGTGNLNRIRNLKLQAVNGLGSKDLFTHSLAGWTLFSTPNKESDRQALEATQMMLRNNWRSPNVYTEDWVVSVPITLHPNTDMGPDYPKGIKSLADKMPPYYLKFYETPGNYKVVFKAVNQSAAGRQEVLKEVNITVLP